MRYCRAECPDYDMKDNKFMKIEEEHGAQCSTPEELFAAIPKVTPMDRGVFLREIPDKDGYYNFDQAMFQGLGEPMKWKNFFAALAKQ